jgi:hypothetical protein
MRMMSAKTARRAAAGPLLCSVPSSTPISCPGEKKSYLQPMFLPA